MPMLDNYQNIPSIVDSVAFTIGSFSLRWYSLMYIVGFVVATVLLRWRIYKKETNLKWNDVLDFLIYSFLGILIGGRLGYVLFYDLIYFLRHPVEIISPFQNGELVGIYGMSFFGAVCGIAIVLYLFAKKRKISAMNLLDFILPAVPAGYFFGRIGNFLNNELYGRVTDSPWGMFFGNQNVLRHPSQLYEAFLEGLVLFVVLWFLRNKFKTKSGWITGIYLIGYGMIRFVVEFFREPDAHIGFVWGYFTLGQIFSLVMIFIGAVIIYSGRKRE